MRDIPKEDATPRKQAAQWAMPRLSRPAPAIQASSPASQLMPVLGLLLLVLAPLLTVGWIGEEVLEQERFAFESPLLLWVHAHTTPALLHLSAALHVLGGPEVMGPLFVAIPAALWLRQRAQALFALWALGGAVLLNALMKLVFHRPRPELWPRTVAENGASFPSGHSMFAAALCSVAVLLLWRTRWRWPALGLGVTYCLLMGGARLVLGVHYPTDVLAGLLTGLAWVYGVWALLGRPGSRAGSQAVVIRPGRARAMLGRE